MQSDRQFSVHLGATKSRSLHAVFQHRRQVHRPQLRRLQFAACVIEYLLDHRVHALDVGHHACGLCGRREVGAQAQAGERRAQIVRHCGQHSRHLLRLFAQAGTARIQGCGKHLHFAWAVVGQRRLGMQIEMGAGIGQAAQRSAQTHRRPCSQRRQQHHAAQQGQHHLPSPGSQIAVGAADHPPAPISLLHGQFERWPRQAGEHPLRSFQSGRIAGTGLLPTRGDDVDIRWLAVACPDQPHPLGGMMQGIGQLLQARMACAFRRLRAHVQAQPHAVSRALAAQYLHGLVESNLRCRRARQPAHHRHADGRGQQQAADRQHRNPTRGAPAQCAAARAHRRCTAGPKR